MFGLGTVEILVIVGVVLLLFGGKKLPEFARGLSEATKEFGKGLKEDEHDKKSKDEHQD